jgi:hypothetical protein
MQNNDLFFVTLLLLVVSALVLVALPAVLFVYASRRYPGLELTRAMRAAVLFSGLCLVALGVWSGYWLWPSAWVAAAAALAAFGAFVIARGSRGARRAPGDGPRLAYGGSTVVGVLVLLLAAAAVPKFGCGCGKGPAYRAAMKSDLRNLATVQEMSLLEGHRFESSGPGLDSLYRPMSGVTITAIAQDSSGWHATASHSSSLEQCAIWVGVRPPNVPALQRAAEAEPVCWEPDRR